MMYTTTAHYHLAMIFAFPTHKSTDNIICPIPFSLIQNQHGAGDVLRYTITGSIRKWDTRCVSYHGQPLRYSGRVGYDSLEGPAFSVVCIIRNTLQLSPAQSGSYCLLIIAIRPCLASRHHVETSMS